MKTLFFLGAAIFAVSISNSDRAAAMGGVPFDLDSITTLKWTVGDRSVTLKKEKAAKKTSEDLGDLWSKTHDNGLPKDFSPDSWSIHRRLVLLEQTATPNAIEAVASPSGTVELAVGKEKIEGAYDDTNFVWKNGPDAGHGFSLASNPDFKSLLDEGIMGLSSHEMSLCDPKKVTEIDDKQAGWSLQKEKSRWTLTLKAQGAVPARPFEAVEWIGRVCKIKVESFIGAKNAAGDVALRILSGKKEVQVTGLKPAGYAIANVAAFKSGDLNAALLVSTDYLKDVSVEAGKIALDIRMPQKDRIDAIRKMRDSHSPESVFPLKKIIDQETEIDLYRYEAVDALQAIGTKAAFKAIADRLGQMGRSGFELRLARALAMGMGSSFRSDEKTPEPERRKEVQDLLERARKDPPGR